MYNRIKNKTMKLEKTNYVNTWKLNRKANFKDISHGKTNSPTDFDMVFNIRNEITFIADAKESYTDWDGNISNKHITFGQTITYTEMGKARAMSGVPTYVLWCGHEDTYEDIVMKDCNVFLYFYFPAWTQEDWLKKSQDMSYEKLFKIKKITGITVNEFIHNRIKYHKVKEYDWNSHKDFLNKYFKLFNDNELNYKGGSK